MNFISRVVGGWQVRMTLKGSRHGKFFADTKFSGNRKARQAAMVYRDELLARRAASQPKPKPRPILVHRGEADYLQIRIPLGKGKTKTTEFSVKKHGPKKARQLAMAAFAEAMRQ